MEIFLGRKKKKNILMKRGYRIGINLIILFFTFKRIHAIKRRTRKIKKKKLSSTDFSKNMRNDLQIILLQLSLKKYSILNLQSKQI